MNNPCADRQALVFDLGGTCLRCGIWSSSNGINCLRRIKIDSFLTASAPVVWANLMSHIQDYAKSVKNVVSLDSPVVISFPGPIKNRRWILQAPTVLGGNWELPDLGTEVERCTGRKTYVLNDISAAAWYMSLRAPVSRFMIATVSSGIGSKVFDSHHPLGVMDSSPWAGEIGHLVVDPSSDAPLCDCGASGHLGAISSGRGIERAARRSAHEEPGKFAQSACASHFGATPSTLNNEDHLVPAARLGDEWCLQVIRRATRPLVRVLLSVAVGAGLERVFIIGGFALSLGSVYLQLLLEEVADECSYSVLAPDVESLIELGLGCEDACLMGAGVFASQLLENSA